MQFTLSRINRLVGYPHRAFSCASGIGIFNALRKHDPDSSAILNIDSAAPVTYRDLMQHSFGFADKLLQVTGSKDLRSNTVLIMCPPSSSFAIAQFGIWQSGGVAVPVSVAHPPAEIEYIVQDCSPVAFIVHPMYKMLCEPIATRYGVPLIVFDASLRSYQGSNVLLPVLTAQHDATVMYTSGTTGRPKGVLTSHGAIQAQICDLIKAWKWTNSDRILHFLPLHHVHGLVNKLLCSLWAGATCRFIKFEPTRVWKQLVEDSQISVFMAVPTVYVKMIEAYEGVPPEDQKQYSAAARRLRLMVSGSAPLPVSVLRRWKEITGHMLLERYGMTEFGMALSNPYDVALRREGCVGNPLPSARVRIVASDDNGNSRVVSPPEETQGELRVAGPILFSKYLNKPAATAEAFDEDGYFRTGDVARWSALDNAYRILGRSSVDILKVGGHKVSALEIERAILELPSIAEVAVCGIPDETYGQAAAAVVRAKDKHADRDVLRAEIQQHCLLNLGKEKQPRKIVIVEEIAKNAMGKVNKKELAQQLQDGLS